MPATFKYFVYDDRTDTNGECAIYLRITCQKKKKYYNTGMRVAPHYLRDNPRVGYWIKKSHRTYRKLNQDLEGIFNQAKKAAQLLRSENKESAAAIKDRMIGASKKNFFVMADDELQELEENDQFYLKKQTNATLSKLEEFNGSKDLKFTEINSDYLSRFQKWMQDEKDNKGTTIRKNMSDMRRILERAKEAKLMFSDPFDDVKPVKQKDPEPKVKLTHDQIEAMANLSLPEDSTNWHARNVFVLSFYFNGIRFGDLARLKWKDVENERLSYRMSKTGNVVYFAIPDQAEEILDLYRNENKSNNDYIFPFLARLPKYDKTTVENQISKKLASVNKAIKKVGKKAEINEDIADQISSHVARHSFAQYLVDKGVSIYEISRQLRHTKVSTTENYLDRLGLQAKDQTMDNPFK